MNKKFCMEDGKKINNNKRVDWSELETFCCRNQPLCGTRHNTLDEMMGCGSCNYSVPARFKAMLNGIYFLMRTNWGMKKAVIYDSWVEKR